MTVRIMTVVRGIVMVAVRCAHRNMKTAKTPDICALCDGNHILDKYDGWNIGRPDKRKKSERDA
jgi:hypothetical protein